MAAQISFNTWMRDDIGFADNARVAHMAGLGMTDFNSLLEFEDSDIKTLCSSARKEVPPFPITVIIEKRLKLACFGAKEYEKVGRLVDRDALSVARLRRFKTHKDSIDNHVESINEVPKVSKTYTIEKALDNLPTILRDKLGSRGVPLSYVIRDNEDPPAGPMPALIPQGIHSESYGNITEELIAYIRLAGDEYNEDNASVYNIISDMVKDTPHASSLKGFMRARNGRGSYLALVTHNLGQGKWDKITARAEDIIQNRDWNGRNFRWTLENHCAKHREAYNDLVRASEFTEYQLPDERTRVTRLLNSIKADHIPAIAAAKCTIQNDVVKRNDFEEAADFLILNSPKQRNINRDTRNISALTTEQREHLNSLGHVDVGNKDRFYTPTEYRQLSKEQKTKLWLLRLERGAKSNKNNQSKASDTTKVKKRAKYLDKKNKQLRRKIAALEAKDDPGDSTDMSDDDEKGEPVTRKVTFNQRKKAKTS